jgi:hypothetical protein
MTISTTKPSNLTKGENSEFHPSSHSTTVYSHRTYTDVPWGETFWRGFDCYICVAHWRTSACEPPQVKNPEHAVFSTPGMGPTTASCDKGQPSWKVHILHTELLGFQTLSIVRKQIQFPKRRVFLLII